jgi:hypothetical protein
MLLVTLSAGCVASFADENTFTLSQPLAHATVREVVAIGVPRAMLNQASYATVTIDGQFRGAPAVPSKGAVVFRWDTKGASDDAGQDTAPQQATDGNHTIAVALFDKDSNEIAQGTTTVRVANMITSLPDGVRLHYKWRSNEVLDYTFTGSMKRTDTSDASDTFSTGVTTGTPDAGGNLEDVNLQFDRSVEDIMDSQILLRDHILDNGTVSTSGTRVQSAFPVASKYWTVNDRGDLLVDNKPISGGAHFGFPILQLPSRRVNVGDSWQCPIMASLQFSSDHLSLLPGQARLDSFEWQNGYPTAKITESYSGPATFTVTSSQGALPPVHANSVQLTRTVWFAYEAGMVVRSVTKMSSADMMGSNEVAALGSSTSAYGPGQPSAMSPMGTALHGPPPGFGAPGAFVGGPGFRPPSAYGPPVMQGPSGPFGPPMASQVPGAPIIDSNPLLQQQQQQDAKALVKIASDSTINLSSVDAP